MPLRYELDAAIVEVSKKVEGVESKKKRGRRGTMSFV